MSIQRKAHSLQLQLVDSSDFKDWELKKSVGVGESLPTEYDLEKSLLQ